MKGEKTVDSFKFLPRLIAAYYQRLELAPRGAIPWTPLPAPIEGCRFALLTSGGIYHRELHEPFDLERERAQPTWGDASYRELPVNMRQEQVAVSHLHISPNSLLEDVNVLLPIEDPAGYSLLQRGGECGQPEGLTSCLCILPKRGIIRLWI